MRTQFFPTISSKDRKMLNTGGEEDSGGAGEDAIELTPFLNRDEEVEVPAASEMAGGTEGFQNKHAEADGFSVQEPNQYPSKKAKKKAESEAKKKQKKELHVKIENEKLPQSESKESGQANDLTSEQPSAPPPQKQIVQRPRYHFAAHKCDFNGVNKLRQNRNIDVQELDRNNANCLDSLVRTKVDEKSDNNFEKIRKTFEALLPQGMNGESVKAMLENEDKNSYTAMERAAFEGKRRTLRLLLDRYVNVASPWSLVTLTEIPPETSGGPCRGQTEAAQYPISRSSPECVDATEYKVCRRFPVTSLGRTLLHSAASAGQTETAQDLLARWPEMIDAKDNGGFTALHIAAKYRHDSVVMLLIERGASLSELDNGGEPAALPVMCISKAREGVIKQLDQSLSFEDGADGPYKKRHKIKIDLNRTILNHDEELPESYVLSKIAELDLEIIDKFLLHPVCKTFVELKLQRLRAFCYANILFYFTFLVTFTALSIQSGVVTNFFSNHTEEKADNNSTRGKEEDIVLGTADENSVLSVVTTVFASICVLRRVYFVWFYISTLWKKRTFSDVESSVPMRNFKTKGSKENWWRLFCEIVGIAIFAWTISVIWSRDTSFVKHSVSILLLIFWCKTVFLFEVFPSCGIYIMKLKAVLWTFSKIFTIFIPLLVGFVLAFCVIFKGKSSIPKSFSTMLAMMLGEYNEEKMFESENLPITGHIIFVFFIFVVSIVLINLWVGLSVSDVSSLKLSPEIRLAKSNIERLRLAEDLALFVKKSFCGPAVFWEQVKVFSDKSYGIIHVSLKKPDTKDLFSQNNKSNSKRTFQEYAAYILFKFGIVFYNTSLYRKHPICSRLQDQLERVALINIEKQVITSNVCQCLCHSSSC